MGVKTKNKNTGSDSALHLHISEDELETLAAETFFPQPSTLLPPHHYQIQTENAHLPKDSLFNMGELVIALNTAKCNTAPCPDRISITALRKLQAVGMPDLLNWFNDVWETGLLPKDWKLSTLIPIPKPGKSLTNISTLRRISLTSKLFKAVDDPEQIDKRLYVGTTHLIAKKKRASQRKELRPITCLPNTYKLLSKVVTALVTGLCEVNEVIWRHRSKEARR
ncbi:hypothetical protein HPB47_017325 [Ixodes persulcatus]|uniref:Uncharacterized protein n=1 Tax=Ixodes persulcatus TaxID=34615 RepID=A0AC60QS56_IXOPE|nr:hypothetical protein HPB47_017325 [Ixodes persulcatus]